MTLANEQNKLEGQRVDIMVADVNSLLILEMPVQMWELKRD